MITRRLALAATGVLLVSSLFIGEMRGAEDARAKLPPPGPEKGGLASLYPGDEAIERDPRVLFVDDFETGTVDEIGERWGQISERRNFLLTRDIHAKSPGNRSIRIAKNGYLYTHTRNVDVMYARFYVKFHPKTGYNHHFVHLQAERVPHPWPMGRAGRRPPGDGNFSTGIEPGGRGGKFPPPGVWHFYTYWHEMKTRWGTVYHGKQQQIEPGRWYCMEVMLKANSAGDKADGEQAFWVDGELYGHFKNFRWRTTDKLKINSFWLLYYNTTYPARANRDRKAAERVMQVWFDDIVIATEYVGPVNGRPKAGKKKATPSRSALLTAGLLLPEPGKVVYSRNFEQGPGKFKGGEVAGGGVPSGPRGPGGTRDDGSKAFSFGPAGCSVWEAYATPVKDSTTVRFKLKPLCDVKSATVMIWSKKLKDNCRYEIRRLRKNEWRIVEFRAIECRTGWGMGGPSLEGSVLDNFKLFFPGREGDRFLIDDFEVRE